MAQRGEAVHVVQWYGHDPGHHGRTERCPVSPARPGANPGPRQSAHSYPKADQQPRHGYLEVADVVVEMRTKGPDLFRRATDALRRKPQLDEAGEIPDQEDQSIADKPNAAQSDEICAHGVTCRDRVVSRHAGPRSRPDGPRTR